ncbi:hypothetical protein PUN4_240028 [Paraburkholderia unamae]|nr:hypothetical protein PUN4_240028 [Paraburkholderia unamae]
MPSQQLAHDALLAEPVNRVVYVPQPAIVDEKQNKRGLGDACAQTLAGGPVARQRLPKLSLIGVENDY